MGRLIVLAGMALAGVGAYLLFNEKEEKPPVKKVDDVKPADKKVDDVTPPAKDPGEAAAGL